MTERPRIWLDNNVWDILFDRGIDLATELPPHDFELLLTRQVEIEARPIARKHQDKAAFIVATVDACGIKVRPLFGFDRPETPPDMRRYGGFDEGHWASRREGEFIRAQNEKHSQTKLKNSGLFHQESDIALAAKSFDDIVITGDERRGEPLWDAASQGGAILWLRRALNVGRSLRSACDLMIR